MKVAGFGFVRIHFLHSKSLLYSTLLYCTVLSLLMIYF